MAAGITIDTARISAFSEFLNDRLAGTVGEAQTGKALLLDAVLSPKGVNPLFVEAMDGAGPYGMGWPAPRIATGPVRIVKCDIVGTNHVRMIVAGDDGGSIETIAFRAAETELGQTLLSAPKTRKLWIAGRGKNDDWGSRPAAEIHLADAAWAD